MKGKSESYKVNNGLRQGDSLSKVPFDITLEKITRDSRLHLKGNTYYKDHQILAYTDDIVIMAQQRELTKDISRLKEGRKKGLI